MGGAQPLAATMNGAAFLGVDVDESRIRRRVETRYCDRLEHDLDAALRALDDGEGARGAPSRSAWSGNIAEVLPELVRRGVVPDVLTDQTSAHDLRLGYIPAGLSLAEAATLRERDPAGYEAACARLDGGARAGACWRSRRGARSPSTTATTCGARWPTTGACARPSTSPASCRPTSGRSSAAARARSAGPRCPATRRDIAVTDRARARDLPEERGAGALDPAGAASGCSSRACPRASAGWSTASARRWALRFNWLVKHGKVRAPHRDRARPPRHRLGRVAQPRDRGHADGSDAIADWPLLNALLNTACGASWVSLHHGGGVGIGYSIHAGHGGRRRRHRRRRTGGSSACSPPIRAPASCATRTPATTLAIETAQRERRCAICRCCRHRSIPRHVPVVAMREHEAAREHRPARHLPSRGRAGGDPCDRRRGAGVGRRTRSAGSGRSGELPAEYDDAERLDAGGGLVIPGLVDCHTHLAFGGWRADEFEQRHRGAELPGDRAGGRRHRTNRALTRASDRRRALAARATGSCARCCALGVTTVECKSGYGLDRENELRLLRLYRALAAAQPVRLVADLPRRARGAAGVSATTAPAYVALLIDELIPHDRARAAGRAFATCSWSARRSPSRRRGVCSRWRAGAGLGAKLHADQLSAGGGAELAAEVGAVSADHLDARRRAGIAAMARAGVVAVSLPIASLYLGQSAAAGAAAHRRGRVGRGGDRLQPGLRAELPPAIRAHPRLHARSG